MRASWFLLLGILGTPAGHPVPPRVLPRHAVPRTAVAPNMSYLDNGTIRVGVDLNMGGAITYLSKSSDSANVVWVPSPGGEIGPSCYAGPTPYGNPNPDWPNWPWNPVVSGDSYGNPSTVVASANDGKALYVRTVPLQWALNDVPCECFFETWIALDGNAVRLRYRLSNHRSDLAAYGAYGQELPAVYTIGKLWRIFTYDGDSPFTGATVREVPYVAAPPWQNLSPTENWVALVDDSGWGLGVLNDEVYFFLAGFSGTPDAGGPADSNTGYIAPVRDEILDQNVAYDYDATLVLGTVADIRSYAVAHRRVETRPDLHFSTDRFQEDRQHITYVNATDSGLPIKGGLHVLLDQSDPQIWLPESRWDAGSLPTLYLTAAFHTHETTAEVFWAIPGQGFDGSRRLDFTVIPDGQMRTYAIPLWSAATYSGTITRLRLDPSDGGTAGDWAEIASISFQPEPGGRTPRVVGAR